MPCCKRNHMNEKRYFGQRTWQQFTAGRCGRCKDSLPARKSPFFMVNYNETICDPMTTAEKVSAFLGFSLDVQHAAAIVNSEALQGTDWSASNSSCLNAVPTNLPMTQQQMQEVHYAITGESEEVARIDGGLKVRKWSWSKLKKTTARPCCGAGCRIRSLFIVWGNRCYPFKPPPYRLASSSLFKGGSLLQGSNGKYLMYRIFSSA